MTEEAAPHPSFLALNVLLNNWKTQHIEGGGDRHRVLTASKAVVNFVTETPGLTAALGDMGYVGISRRYMDISSLHVLLHTNALRTLSARERDLVFASRPVEAQKYNEFVAAHRGKSYQQVRDELIAVLRDM